MTVKSTLKQSVVICYFRMYNRKSTIEVVFLANTKQSYALVCTKMNGLKLAFNLSSVIVSSLTISGNALTLGPCRHS